jgi:hypothetical protein
VASLGNVSLLRDLFAVRFLRGALARQASGTPQNVLFNLP